MASIARNQADNDVVIGNVVNNEAGTARNQARNLEVLIELARQTVYILEDLIDRVSAIKGIPKTSVTYFSPREGELYPRMTNKEREQSSQRRSQIIRATNGIRRSNANERL
jgi:hypothetical protein